MAQEFDPTSAAARTAENADANREALAKNAEANVDHRDHNDTQHRQSPPAASELADVREFSRSSNGDSWSVGKNCYGSIMVLHRGNEPSGGYETISSVQDFLKNGPAGPQHDTLIAMLSAGDDRGNEVQASNLPGLI